MKRVFILLVLLTAGAFVANAQKLALKSVGGEVGFTSFSFAGGGTSTSIGGFVIGAVANLGEFATGFGLYPGIAYSTGSKDLGAGFGTWSVSDLEIDANAHYNIQVSGPVKPYVGAGLGLNFLSSTTQVTIPFFGTVSASGSATRLGINLIGGAETRMGEKLNAFAQFRYVVAADYNHFAIVVGALYSL